MRILPGTLAHSAYRTAEVTEAFRCRYGLNPRYRDELVQGGVKIAGTGPDGEVRIVELPDHPFFVATLFLPQLASGPGHPHPLIVAYLRMAMAHRDGAGRPHDGRKDETA